MLVMHMIGCEEEGYKYFLHKSQQSKEKQNQCSLGLLQELN